MGLLKQLTRGQHILNNRLGDRAPQRLACTNGERNARPAPGIDLKPQRAVGLNVALGVHSGLAPVALKLTAHEVLGQEWLDGAEHLHLLVRDALGIHRHRRLHGKHADKLQQVVLHDIAQTSDSLVERPAALDAE